MTAFGWKRKAGANLVKNVPTFEADPDDSSFEIKIIQNNFSIKKYKHKKLLFHSDVKLKIEQLKAEGIKLAEKHKFEEAIIEWDKALSYLPTDDKILEMKAQALLQLNCHFPAIQTAEKAIKFNPCWWVAYQTLGRAQLGIGELEMAKRSFSKAIHLNPTERELWDEDLNWTLNLFKQKETLDVSNESKNEVNADSSIKYDEEGYILDCDISSKSKS
ncbi:tetratricopeptide repeat protein 33-like [Uloborus diversus]|uniref:tetratricopeptide repeat protein 33-like n=1 Tax=Uloborus diversus TaxID=327109 RepID=UPI00240A5CED|nr:tetratricopeptide repeat protein 33-like [Uloborus diversus]